MQTLKICEQKKSLKSKRKYTVLGGWYWSAVVFPANERKHRNPLSPTNKSQNVQLQVSISKRCTRILIEIYIVNTCLGILHSGRGDIHEP